MQGMTLSSCLSLAMVGLAFSCSEPEPHRPGRTSEAVASSTTPGETSSLPEAFQRGVNFDHLGGFDRRIDQHLAARSLDYLRERLSVRHVAITPSFFQKTLTDTSFYYKRDRDDIDAIRR